MTDVPAQNKISRIDKEVISLAAATATGAGAHKEYPAPVNMVSMQVSYTGGPSAVKVRLEGTIDRVNWFTIATFDTGASGASGNIVSSTGTVINGARAYLETLTGGEAPTVSAYILANRGG